MNLVFTNGCFDILHIGHIELFKFCKNFGDYLVIGIDSDRRVLENKGKGRPINTVNDRRDMLLSIRYVDRVEIFDSDQELTDLVKSLSPTTMVVGSDWKNHNIIGSNFAKELKFFDRIESYATSKIIQNIINRR